MFEENKEQICKLLLPVLQSTRNLYDLIELEYSETETGHEVVFARFASGAIKHANVTADSGTAMIQDIIKQIV